MLAIWVGLRQKCARSGHKFIVPYCRDRDKLLISVHTSIPYTDKTFTYCETGTTQTQSHNLKSCPFPKSKTSLAIACKLPEINLLENLMYPFMHS